MSKLMVRSTLLGLMLLCANALFAVTYIVPSDREMVRRAKAIVIGEALSSYTQLNDSGAVETVTSFSISEVLKGSIEERTIEIHEPGGRYGDHFTGIPGVPRFTDGEKVLLMLSKTGADHWAVTDWALGRFTFATDSSGRSVAVRAETDLVGWDTNGQPHKETRRSAADFISFIRDEARGGVGRANYVVPFEPLASDAPKGKKIPVRTLSAGAVTYAEDFGGAYYRWNSFPTVTTFLNANGGSTGNTAVTAAVAMWNGAAGAQVNLANGGTDSRCSTPNTCKGLGPGDGFNDVLFEQDLQSKYGIGTFSCLGGGLLGAGGVNGSTGTHSFAGSTWNSTSEGDVEMNVGVIACIGARSDFTATTLAVAVGHELGHTLGFRHSDSDPTLKLACNAGAGFDCSTNAIMYHTVPYSATGLLPWDLSAVDAIYPASTVGAPTGVAATPTGATSVQIIWTAPSGASGSTVYEVHRSTDNTSFVQVCTATHPTVTCSDPTAAANTAYVYKVRAGSSGTFSTIDLATTRSFTNAVATGGTVQAIDVTETRALIDKVRALTGLGGGTYSAITGGVTTIQRTHVLEMRTALDQGRASLLAAGCASCTALSYTDSTITVNSTTVKAAHFNELRNGLN